VVAFPSWATGVFSERIKAMRARKTDDTVTLGDVGARFLVVLMVVGITCLFVEALDREADFYSQRRASHLAECSAAQAGQP
jgi:hypothetical protein